MLFVRENTEGEYAGVGGRSHRGLPLEVGVETSIFTRAGVERVVRHAFGLAMGRRRLLTSATKSNASRFGYVLWDEVVEEVHAEFPDVVVERVLVDALAARMVRDPGSLDVVVASNLFADVLTDLAAAIQGGMGMAASANVQPGGDAPGVFEPVHGSAPDIAGQGVANPVGAIWSTSLMLEQLGEAGAAASGAARARGRLPRRPAHARRGWRRRPRGRWARRSSRDSAERRLSGRRRSARRPTTTRAEATTVRLPIGLAPGVEQRREHDRPQRLGRVERRDEADPAAGEPGHERRVGEPEAGALPAGTRGTRPRACCRLRRPRLRSTNRTVAAAAAASSETAVAWTTFVPASRAAERTTLSLTANSAAQTSASNAPSGRNAAGRARSRASTMPPATISTVPTRRPAARARPARRPRAPPRGAAPCRSGSRPAKGLHGGRRR